MLVSWLKVVKKIFLNKVGFKKIENHFKHMQNALENHQAASTQPGTWKKSMILKGALVMPFLDGRCHGATWCKLVCQNQCKNQCNSCKVNFLDPKGGKANGNQQKTQNDNTKTQATTATDNSSQNNAQNTRACTPEIATRPKTHTTGPLDAQKCNQHNSSTRKSNTTHFQHAKAASTMHRAQHRAHHKAQPTAQPRAKPNAQPMAQPRAQPRPQHRTQPNTQPRPHTPLDHWMHKNATSTTQVPEKATPHIFSMQKQHPQCTGHNTEHITRHNPLHSQGPSPMHSQWHNPGHSPGHSTGHSPIPSPGHNTRHNPGHTTRHNTGPKPRAQHSPVHNPMHSPGHSPGHNRMHNRIHSTWQNQTTSINPTLQYTISIGFCIEIFAKTQIIENTGPFVTRASLYGTFWGPIKGLPFKKDVLGECCFPDWKCSKKFFWTKLVSKKSKTISNICKRH